MPHLARALATPVVDLLAIGVARYADIVYQPMTAVARLDCIPGRRPVLYLAEDASEEEQARAFHEARLALLIAPDAALTADPVPRLRLVS